MQIYSKSGMSLGKKDKSHMAEFSANPDERKKREVPYSKHLQKVKAELDEQDALRIKVNKIRHEKGLELFSDREAFEDFVEESGLEDGPLFHFLITYGSDEEIEYGSIETNPIIIHDYIPYISSSFLAEYLCLEQEEIKNLSAFIDHKFIKLSHIKPISLKNGKGFLISYYRFMLFILIVNDCALLDKLYDLYNDMKILNNNNSWKNLIELLDPGLKKLELMIEEKKNTQT